MAVFLALILFFEDLPKTLLPFDFTTYYNYPGTLQVGTTDCRTGQDVWFGKEAIGKSFTPVRASSSMPFLAPIVKFDRRELLDGALVSPIPYKKHNRKAMKNSSLF